MIRNENYNPSGLIDSMERRRLLAAAYRILLLAAERKPQNQEISFESVAGEVTNLPVTGVEHSGQVKFQKGGKYKTIQ